MKVLIFGISGQTGSWMADYLLDNTDYDIVGVERRLSTRNKTNISHLDNNKRVRMVSGDLTDAHSIDAIISEEKPNFCINFAAQSFVSESWISPASTFNINAIGVINILEAIRKYAPTCRFSNSGSSEQFGDVIYTPQDINHPMRSRSVYGASKVASGQIVKVYRESYNMFAIQPIFFNNESSRRGEMFVTRKITLGVVRIVNAIKENQSFVPIELGNLEAQRDWSHALDFCDGIWKMLNQAEPKEYVLSSGETHSIKEFVELSFKFAGIKNCFWGQSGSYYYPSQSRNLCLVAINPKFFRPADVEVLQGDSTPIRKELGWKPKVSFEELVHSMVDNDINLYGKLDSR